MKKLLAFVLAGVMVMGMSVTALADTQTFDSRDGEAPGKVTTVTDPYSVTTGEVKVTMNPSAAEDVYYVVVDWNDLSFNYDFGSAAEWNPADHSYAGEGNGAGWTTGNVDRATQDMITVKNHSNKAVKADASFAEDNVVKTVELYGVKATLSSEISLASGEDVTYAYAEANPGKFSVSVEGVPNKMLEEFLLGTVVVKITPSTTN